MAGLSPMTSRIPDRFDTEKLPEFDPEGSIAFARNTASEIVGLKQSSSRLRNL